jgi:segregation and condensation protein B
MMNEEYRHSAVEALVLSSPDPLPGRKIAQLIEDMTPSDVAESVAELNTGYAANGSSFRIREIAGGYQFYILPEYVGFVEDMFSRHRKLRLTRAALETMAVIAYRQPTTKTDVEHIRGVASDGVLRTLLERNLITVTGRANTVGKPLQYGTTSEFLKFFGLNSLNDLPKMTEIEQLISATDPQDRVQLKLDVDTITQSLKLNIADGTYDPEERERLDESDFEEPETKPSNTVRLVVGSDHGGDTTDEVDRLTEDEIPAEAEISILDDPMLRAVAADDEFADSLDDSPDLADEGYENDRGRSVKVILKKGPESAILDNDDDQRRSEAGITVDSDSIGG